MKKSAYKVINGFIIFSDGEGEGKKKNILLEISVCGGEQWVYLTRSQALRLGKLLVRFGEGEEFED